MKYSARLTYAFRSGGPLAKTNIFYSHEDKVLNIPKHKVHQIFVRDLQKFVDFFTVDGTIPSPPNPRLRFIS